MSQLIIKFKGDKESIHREFKAWCASRGISMTAKLIDVMDKISKDK